jgi:hypothetical protein
MSKKLLVLALTLLGFLFGIAQQTQAASTCSSQQDVNTQFRFSGNGDTPWISGSELTSAQPRVGQRIDVNCFAKTGTAHLEGGVIDLRFPNGGSARVSNTPELRDYTLSAAGNYTFTCSSTTVAQCSNVDSFTVYAGSPTPTPSPVITPRPTPTPSASPRPTSTPTPSPVPTPSPQISTCDNLEVISGNDSIIPAKVTLRARGSDNKGSIQAYRFYFGDGDRVETSNTQVTHEYKVSGTFVAKVEIKDSLGNYKTSNSCEAQVRVKPSSVESHKSACSDVFITADNGGRAPSKVKFTVTGYDNKDSIDRYKVEFGNGITKENEGNTFEQIYDKAGTYEIKAYILNSNNDWVGGNESCRRTMTIGSTQPLTSQPSTGTPTVLPILGVGSGLTGLALQLARRKRVI